MGHSGEATDVSSFTKLTDQLTEEEKQGSVGKAFDYIISVVRGGWSFVQTFRNTDELNKMNRYKEKLESLFERLKADKSICKDKILEVIDEHEQNCSETFDKDVPQGKVTEIENVKLQIMEKFANHCGYESSKLITDIVKGSYGQIKQKV